MSEPNNFDVEKTDKSALNDFFTNSKIAHGVDEFNKNILYKSAGILRACDQVGVPGSGDLSNGLKNVVENTLGKNLSIKSISADVLENLAENKSLKDSVKNVVNEYKKSTADLIRKATVDMDNVKEKINNYGKRTAETMKNTSGCECDFVETDFIIAKSYIDSSKPNVLDAKNEIRMQRKSERGINNIDTHTPSMEIIYSRKR